MTAIRETCSCGSKIRVTHSDPEPIAARWRDTHPCDRRAHGEREVVSGATAEVAYTEPHRTDSNLGFRRGLDDTEPMGVPVVLNGLNGREIARAIDRQARTAAR